MLAARIQKQKSKGKGKPSVERKNKKEKKGIIIPTMNRYQRNGQKGDPKFSTE